MSLIERFHREVGVLVKGDIWNRELPQVEFDNTLYPTNKNKER